MANMHYCRFQNTLQELRDCYADMAADSPEESKARERLIELCQRIANEYGEG